MRTRDIVGAIGQYHQLVGALAQGLGEQVSAGVGPVVARCAGDSKVVQHQPAAVLGEGAQQGDAALVLRHQLDPADGLRATDPDRADRACAAGVDRLDQLAID